jgi:hypothetical protein
MSETQKKPLERAFTNLTGLTKTWAAFGLNVGKSAMRQSAQTLETGAALLGDLSSKLKNGRAESKSESQE